jgi:hypothetical protein
VIDAYVAKLNRTGSTLLFASFLGGSESEVANDAALDAGGNVYLTGHTYSADFTTTAAAFDRPFGGDTLIFLGRCLRDEAVRHRHVATATASVSPAGGSDADQPRRRGRGLAAPDLRLERCRRGGLLHDPGQRDLRVGRAADHERYAHRFAVHNQLAARPQLVLARARRNS